MRAAACTLLSLSLACARPAPTVPEESEMPRRQSTAELLRLSEGDLYELSEDDRNELVSRLAFEDFEGLLLAAPARVALDARELLPLLVVRQGSLLRDWHHAFADEGVLVHVDLASGEARAVPLVHDPKAAQARRRPARAPRGEPPADAAETLVTDALRLDARAHLQLDWRPGAHLLHALWYDWSSDPASVELAATKGARPAAPAALTRDGMAEVQERLESAPHPPTLERLAQAGEPRLGLELPERWEDDGEALPVTGEVCVPLGAGQVLADPPPPGQPAAIARATFFLASPGRQPAPILLELPLEGPAPRHGAPVAFRFRFDLREQLPRTLEPGTHFAWLFAGALRAGPARIEIVGER